MIWLQRLKAATESEKISETLSDGTDKTDRTPLLSVLAVPVGMNSGNLEPTDTTPPWEEVEAAVNACCDARGDSNEHRLALIADCLQMPVTDREWLIGYFQMKERHEQAITTGTQARARSEGNGN
jgi:hypothetical protein